jgi:hypothetical protein
LAGSAWAAATHVGGGRSESLLQELAERRSQRWVLERQFHGGNEESEFVARIVPLSLDFVGEHRGVLDELPQGVGQLNFSVLTRRRLAEDREDLRRQDIPADDGEIRRRIGGRGFLDQVIDPADSRVRVAQSFAMLRNKKQDNPRKKHGNIPL